MGRPAPNQVGDADSIATGRDSQRLGFRFGSGGGEPEQRGSGGAESWFPAACESSTVTCGVAWSLRKPGCRLTALGVVVAKTLLASCSKKNQPRPFARLNFNLGFQEFGIEPGTGFGNRIA